MPTTREHASRHDTRRARVAQQQRGGGQRRQTAPTMRRYGGARAPLSRAKTRLYSRTHTRKLCIRVTRAATPKTRGGAKTRRRRHHNGDRRFCARTRRSIDLSGKFRISTMNAEYKRALVRMISTRTPLNSHDYLAPKYTQHKKRKAAS